jgi:ribonuclease BN (tRNA processing enzyme)
VRLIHRLIIWAPFITLMIVMANTAVVADDQCLHAPVSLQVLGSGGPEFYTNRASTSYLIRRNGQAVAMVDAGSGSKFRFGQSGADFNTIQAILFTHFHVDHSTDFPGYIKSAFFSDRTQNLYVYGPEGNRFMPSTHDFVYAMIGDKASAYPYLSRYLDGSDEYQILVKNINIDKHEVQQINTLNGMMLSAIPVHHGPLPAIAWRIDIGDKSVVFSGDMNGDFNTLAKLANNADLLVAHNAISEDASGVARNLHMPPSVIGDIAKQAGVKKLVLSHRMHRTLGIEQQTLSIIRNKYNKPVFFANDLDCFVP